MKYCLIDVLRNGVTQTAVIGVSQSGGIGVSHTDFHLLENL